MSPSILLTASQIEQKIGYLESFSLVTYLRLSSTLTLSLLKILLIEICFPWKDWRSQLLWNLRRKLFKFSMLGWSESLINLLYSHFPIFNLNTRACFSKQRLLNFFHSHPHFSKKIFTCSRNISTQNRHSNKIFIDNKIEKRTYF